MPAPVWNFAPQGDNGNFESGFDRRNPSETPQWSPNPDPVWPRTTEAGGAIVRGPGYMSSMNGMNGMGDFFEIPGGQQDAQAYYQQQIQSGGMPPPPPGSPASGIPPTPAIVGEAMDETALYTQAARKRPGAMAWESGPAPWEQVPPVGGPAALPPGRAEAAIQRVHAAQVMSGEKKAVEAAHAAKIAADNAVRAAVAGAPKVAATNAATAQAAANVAAGSAKTQKAQQAAAVAQSEATKAVAAANVAANNANGANGANGVGDWMELSGMGGLGFFGTELGGGIKLGHVLAGLGAGALAYWGYKKFKG